MQTAAIQYTASGMPVGPAGAIKGIIQFYRPPTVTDAAGLNQIAQPVAFGQGTNAVGLPIAVYELTLDISGKVMETTGIWGQDNNDPTSVRGKVTLNCGTYVQANGQPLLAVGDFCEIYIGMQITSTAATPVPCHASRWFIDGNGLATTGFNTFKLKLTLDRVNSDPNLKEF